MEELNEENMQGLKGGGASKINSKKGITDLSYDLLAGGVARIYLPKSDYIHTIKIDRIKYKTGLGSESYTLMIGINNGNMKGLAHKWKETKKFYIIDIKRNISVDGFRITYGGKVSYVNY